MWSHAQVRGQPQVLALLFPGRQHLSCFPATDAKLVSFQEFSSLPLASTQKDWDYQHVRYGPAVTRSWGCQQHAYSKCFCHREAISPALDYHISDFSLLCSQGLCVNVGVCTHSMTKARGHSQGSGFSFYLYGGSRCQMY